MPHRRLATPAITHRIRHLILTIALVAGLVGCAMHPTMPPRWVLETGSIVRTTVSFNADATLLASGEANGHVTIWSVGDGHQRHRWQAHAGAIQGLFFADGDRLLTAGEDGTVASWTATGELQHRRTSPATIHDMVVDAAGKLVVTAHSDGAIRRWRLPDLQPIDQRQLHRGGVRTVAYHNGKNYYASGGRDGAVYLWRPNEPPRTLTAPPTDTRDLVFSPDGETLYGAGWFRIFRWRVADGLLTVVPTEHHGLITSLDLSADGRRLATISRQTDSAVQILDTTTLKPVTRLRSHDLCGAYVRFSPSERYLASTSDDATVRIWDLADPHAGRP